MSGILSVGGAGAVGVSGFYPVQINDSLRFEDGSSAVLTRTPSAGNRKTWTYSFWVKRANLNSYAGFLAVGTVDGSEDFFGFDSSHRLYFRYSSGSDFTSTQVFRDVSSWYHIVVVADTTQAQSSSNASNSRLRYYVNGTQITAFDSGTMPSQNFDFRINSAAQHYIGEYPRINSHLDGYLAEINFIDGQALDPTSFGEAKDGTWIPKSYSGSYGTNGFHLEFNGNTNDTSGNGNNWTANNISAHDYVPDSPTNNFAVMNVLSKDDTSVVYSEGNLQAINSTSTSRRTYSTIAVKSGKWYFEYYVNAIGSSTTNAFGVQQATDVWADGLRAYRANGDYFNGTGWASYGATFTTGDIISFAVDYDSDTIEFFKNNVSQGQKTSVGFDTSYDYVALANLVSSFKATANFGQDSTFAGGTTAGGNTDGNGIGDFKYAPPSGFLALCTANLPEPTIISGAEYFNTVLYTGNASTQSITGVGFQPDLVWLKQRSSPTRSHRLNDSVRGANKQLYPDLINAEGTATNELTSFDSDGFSLGSANGVNGIDTYVGWNWKAGTAFSNSAGSNGATIASSGSVNTDAGFSIVSYVGTGSAGTVYHGLSSTPEFITIKDRDYATGRPWGSYHFKLNNGVNPEDERIQLNEVTSETNDTFIFNSTAPTSNVFSVALSSWNNTSNNDIIAYCFHSVDGYSKVGSYTGNGLADGPFVFTGFRPAWVLIKSRTAGYDWVLDDAVRSPYNEGNATLYPNDSYVEYTGGLYGIDFLSNGFKPRTSYGQYNQSGGGYIYLAFAESPQKYSNAR